MQLKVFKSEENCSGVDSIQYNRRLAGHLGQR